MLLVVCRSCNPDAINRQPTGSSKSESRILVSSMVHFDPSVCFQVDLDFLDMPWLFSASDMAVYCTLCAIASYDRSELKKKVIHDGNCRFAHSRKEAI